MPKNSRLLRSIGGWTSVVVSVTATLIAATATAASAYWEPRENIGYHIKNDRTGKCLDVTAAGKADGASVQQWDCSIAWNQQWLFVFAGEPDGGPAWRIKPRHADGKCLDVVGGSHASGTRLQIWACHSGWQQLFYINETFDGGIEITPIYTSSAYSNPPKQLAMPESAQYNNGARAINETHRWSNFQEWLVRPAG